MASRHACLILRVFGLKIFMGTGFPGGSTVKNPSAVQEPQETRVRSLGREDPLEGGMAAHSSVPAWRIPWMEEPGGLQSMESQRRRTRLKQLRMHALVHRHREHWGTCLRQSVILTEPLSERQVLHRQAGPVDHSGSHDASDPWSGLHERTLHSAKACTECRHLLSVYSTGDNKRLDS